MSEYLDTAAVAALLGVATATVTKWRDRHPDFPAPDITVSGRPAWHADRALELIEWNAARPGMGVGGGRPRLLTPAETHPVGEALAVWVAGAPTDHEYAAAVCRMENATGDPVAMAGLLADAGYAGEHAARLARPGRDRDYERELVFTAALEELHRSR